MDSGVDSGGTWDSDKNVHAFVGDVHRLYICARRSTIFESFCCFLCLSCFDSLFILVFLLAYDVFS